MGVKSGGYKLRQSSAVATGTTMIWSLVELFPFLGMTSVTAWMTTSFAVVIGCRYLQRPNATKIEDSTFFVQILNDQCDGLASMLSLLGIFERSPPLCFQLLVLLVLEKDVTNKIIKIGSDITNVVVQTSGEASIEIQDPVDDFSANQFAFEMKNIGRSFGVRQCLSLS